MYSERRFSIFSAVLVTFGMLAGVLVFTAVPAEAATTTAAPLTVAPVRIVIPSIKVNAALDTVGITRSGNMGAPNNFSDAGWYTYGPTPGATGNAVIDGHYESGPNGNGKPTAGVFQNLHNIKAGDDIKVVAANGTSRHFKVVSTNVISKDSSMAPIVASNGTPQLVLITCFGTWLPKEDTFSHRLVVTAVLS